MHIHLKVFCNNKNTNSITADSLRGTHVSHTGQLFFPEEQIAALTADKAYGAIKTARLKIKKTWFLSHSKAKNACLLLKNHPGRKDFMAK